MIAVEAMPNELCSAHEGRLAWINGCALAKDLGELIRVALAERGVNPSSLPKLHQLALVSNQDSIAYARQHSMLPILRAVAQPCALVQHGAPDALTYSKRSGMLTQRRDACCCVECIEEDLSHWHFSWFRRTHQLTGVDWCPVHGCVLSRVEDPNPFIRVPHMWLARGKLKLITACQPKFFADGFLNRYIDIAVGLLGRDRPLSIGQVNECLAQQAKMLGLRISKDGHLPLVSDRLHDIAPASWLDQHLDGWNEKICCNYFHRIDALAATSATSGKGDNYAMAMATLFETAEAAMLAVTSAETLPDAQVTKRDIANRGPQFWSDEVSPHSLEGKSTIKGVATRLINEPIYLRETLAALGLPNLHGANHSALWRAFVRYCEGQNLVESCALEKAKVIEMENLLRDICTRALTTAKMAPRLPAISGSI